MDTTLKVPLSERINLRMVVFAGLLLLLIGYPVYLYLDTVISGGIKQRGDLVEVDLKAMSSFPFDKTMGTLQDIPPKWRALDGKRVMLVGEMWSPQDASPELGSFELVYSIQQCCFSGEPQIQHFIQSRVINGAKVPNLSGAGLIRVIGTLHVDVKKENGQVTSVYQLDVEKIERA